MSSPPRDWPICQRCGRKLIYMIPGDGVNPYYACVCGGTWPPPKAIGEEADPKHALRY